MQCKKAFSFNFTIRHKLFLKSHLKKHRKILFHGCNVTICKEVYENSVRNCSCLNKIGAKCIKKTFAKMFLLKLYYKTNHNISQIHIENNYIYYNRTSLAAMPFYFFLLVRGSWLLCWQVIQSTEPDAQIPETSFYCCTKAAGMGGDGQLQTD